MNNIDFCAIDFETACYNQASACAIGLARVRSGKVTDTFYSLIKPPDGMEILPLFTDIHGITMDQVEGAPDFGELWPQLSSFIGSDFLVAHNSPFDRGVFLAVLSQFSLTPKAPNFECSCARARRAWPHLENHKLDTLSRYLGIEPDHHEALSDAVACAKIYVAASDISFAQCYQ